MFGKYFEHEVLSINIAFQCPRQSNEMGSSSLSQLIHFGTESTEYRFQLGGHWDNLFFLGANIDLLSLHQYLPLGSISLSVDLDKSQHLHRTFICAASVPGLPLDSVLMNSYLPEFIRQAVGLSSGSSLLVYPGAFVERCWGGTLRVLQRECLILCSYSPLARGEAFKGGPPNKE